MGHIESFLMEIFTFFIGFERLETGGLLAFFDEGFGLALVTGFLDEGPADF